jgi:DNA-binding beta-propeller fold protein YncE
VNQLLGFEIGDIKTGKELFEVQVKGYAAGHALRHGCPSHGIAPTPDEKELWLADGVNHYVHVFDTTAMPPKQIADIQLGDSPGWITFDIGAKYVFPSTGDVIDRRTKRIIAALRDETGAQVESEKLLEIDFDPGQPTGNGEQSGVGQNR